MATFFSIAFAAYTWANRFPYFYHSDEESKALQILTGSRNFWHPLLTLNLTAAIAHAGNWAGDAQAITVIGRFLSATFSASAIVFFVQFAWIRKGPFAGILFGVLLLTLPLLFEVSHYCKEDPALLCAFALSLLACQYYLSNPHPSRTLLLGFAVGLAISAKYPGLILLPIYLVVLVVRSRKIGPPLLFVGAAIVTILAINWQWLTEFPALVSGFKREGQMLIAGHDGVSSAMVQFENWPLLLYQHGWAILAVATLGFVSTTIKTRFRTFEFALGSAFFLILILLGFSAKVSERYLLPCMTIVLFFAACGVVQIHRLLPTKLSALLTLCVIGAVLFHPASYLYFHIKDFRRDSRQELQTFIAASIPSQERIATSHWTRLPGIYRGQFLADSIPLDYVADFGTISDLKKLGYRWVVVSDVESYRFLNVSPTGSPRAQSAFQHRQAFYRGLETEAELRWSRAASHVYNLHPGLRLYRLRP